MRTTLRPRRRSVPAWSILCCTALAVSACSSASSTGASSTPPVTPSTSSSTTAGTGSPSSSPTGTGSPSDSPTGTGSPSSSPTGPSSGATDIAQISQPVTSYTVPADPVDTKSLAGKTVYYIPISQQAPAFAIVEAAMKEALAKVDMKLQVCDGAANPSSISACINQAVGAGAAGIVLDAIPVVLAANAASSAQAKGVPVLVTDQLEDPAHPAGAKFGYVTGPGKEMLEASARWIIADSGGKAIIVANQVSDNPSSIAFMEDALAVFKNECPGCTVAVNKVTQSNFNLVSPSTSAAILKTPGVNYVLAEFDNYVQATAAGIQQAGKASSIKLVSTAATFNSLQAMAGGQGPAADVGQDMTFQGWSDTDAILRLAAGKQVPTYTDPYRLFTRSNVKDLKLTQAAAESGEWFGPADFRAKFEALWKAS